MKNLFWALTAFIVLFASGCSKNDDPDNGGYVKPEQTVTDPTGTIELSMRNNDDTSLNGLYIGKDDNFHGSGWQIASIGAVKGLGNVSTIPTSGWSDKVAVTPGNGYVAYNQYSEEFYRIYVSDYIISTLGGVIGAEIKYQKPFKGLDEDIRLKQSKVVLPSEGGSQEIVFENTSIVPFKVTSSESWCKVRKGSTRTDSFLADAVIISAEEYLGAIDQTATVTIETLYGKKSEINVTLTANKEFIVLSEESINVDFNTSFSSIPINVYTNVEPGDIKISSSKEWLSGKFSGGAYSPERRVRWIEKEEVTRAGLVNPVSQEFLVNVEGYTGSEPREGTLFLSYNSIREEINVIQAGSSFYISQTDFDFEASHDLTQSATFSGNINYQEVRPILDVETSKWVNIIVERGRLTITLQQNPSTESRKASIPLVCVNSDLATLNITQKGLSFEIEKTDLVFEAGINLSQSVSYTGSFTTGELKATMDKEASEWINLKLESGNMTVTVQPNPSKEQREATISLSCFGTEMEKIKITQKGVNFNLSKSNLTLAAEGNQNRSEKVTWTGNIPSKDIKVNYQPDAMESIDGETWPWMSVTVGAENITIEAFENSSLESRTGTIVLTYLDLEIGKIKVMQEGLKLEDMYYCFNSEAHTFPLKFSYRQGAKITSSADWCSASWNGNQIILRLSETTEDRGAIISIEGVAAKLYISQSKYKEGDHYQLGNISATVLGMSITGEGYLYYELPGKYQWSTEEINLSGVDSDWDAEKNMAAIKAIPGWETLYPAFAAVDALNRDGVTGWVFPTRMWASLNINAWSSTQCDWRKAYTLERDSNGNAYSQSKTQMLSVIALNTFFFNYFENNH